MDHAIASGVTCEQVLDLLLQYIDEQLDEPLRSRVLSHLEMCPPCSDVASRQQDLTAYFRDVITRMHDMPDDVRSRLVSFVQAAGISNFDAVETLSPEELYPSVPPDPPGMNRPDVVHLGRPVEMGGLKARYFVPLGVIALGLIVWFAVAGQADPIAVDARRYAVAPDIAYRPADESPAAYEALLEQVRDATGNTEVSIPMAEGLKFVGACTSAKLGGHTSVALVYEADGGRRPVVAYTVWQENLEISGMTTVSYKGAEYRKVVIDGDTLIAWSDSVGGCTCIVVVPADHEGDPMECAYAIRMAATSHTLIGTSES